MNTDVSVPNAAFDLDLQARSRGKRDLRVGSVQLGRCGADECVRNHVRSGIALFQHSIPVLIRNWQGVMAMRRQPAVVLRMVVIIVHVGVQRRHDT